MGDPNLGLGSVVVLDGLRHLADRYDGFIFDQWGVLHDGRTAYHGALECLSQLQVLGKSIVVLSNSGKRAYANECRLAAFGFDRGKYSYLVTSGDVAWEALKLRMEPFYRNLGRRCLLLSGDGDESVVEGLALELVESIESADFILLAGLGGAKEPPNYDAIWMSALALKLPLLCTNPDLARLADGGVAPGCGALALRYEGLGGEVHYVGKPYPDVYKYCRKYFDAHSVRRIVAIGDSLQHDIAGGNAAGLDTTFVCSGIHREHFSGVLDDDARHARLVALIGAHGDRQPTWVLPVLRW